MKKLPSNFEINKYGLYARLANEKDSEFILELRTSNHTRFMHDISNDLSRQIEWMKQYKEREKNGLDYYFIFYKDDVPIGVNRIYDINGKEFSTGSWTFSQTAPFGAAFLAQVICREIAFDILGFEYEKDPIGVHVDNTSVLKYNYMVGLKEIGRVTIDKGEYVSLGLNKNDFEKGKELTLKIARIK